MPKQPFAFTDYENTPLCRLLDAIRTHLVALSHKDTLPAGAHTKLLNTLNTLDKVNDILKKFSKSKNTTPTRLDITSLWNIKSPLRLFELHQIDPDTAAQIAQCFMAFEAEFESTDTLLSFLDEDALVAALRPLISKKSLANRLRPGLPGLLIAQYACMDILIQCLQAHEQNITSRNISVHLNEIANHDRKARIIFKYMLHSNSLLAKVLRENQENASDFLERHANKIKAWVPYIENFRKSTHTHLNKLTTLLEEERSALDTDSHSPSIQRLYFLEEKKQSFDTYANELELLESEKYSDLTYNLMGIRAMIEQQIQNAQNALADIFNPSAFIEVISGLETRLAESSQKLSAIGNSLAESGTQHNAFKEFNKTVTAAQGANPQYIPFETLFKSAAYWEITHNATFKFPDHLNALGECLTHWESINPLQHPISAAGHLGYNALNSIHAEWLMDYTPIAFMPRRSRYQKVWDLLINASNEKINALATLHAEQTCQWRHEKENHQSLTMKLKDNEILVELFAQAQYLNNLYTHYQEHRDSIEADPTDFLQNEADYIYHSQVLLLAPLSDINFYQRNPDACHALRNAFETSKKTSSIVVGLISTVTEKYKTNVELNQNTQLAQRISQGLLDSTLSPWLIEPIHSPEETLLNYECGMPYHPVDEIARRIALIDQRADQDLLSRKRQIIAFRTQPDWVNFYKSIHAMLIRGRAIYQEGCMRKDPERKKTGQEFINFSTILRSKVEN